MKRYSLLLLACLLVGAHAYGQVICTNSDSDNTTFGNALAAVCNAGGEVVIAPGTCLLNPTTHGVFTLCNNLTIRGAGRASVLKISPSAGQFATLFGASTAISNVVIKDFRVDEGSGAVPGTTEFTAMHVINLARATGITVSGMFFDPMVGAHGIHLESNSDLFATITNNYFNFQIPAGATQYNNTAIYLDGSQQIVTGNTFFSSPAGGGGSLSSYANNAIQTLGGRSTISNNTSNNYATLVTVSPSAQSAFSPNNIVVGNNSITCAQVGISLWPTVTTTSPPSGMVSNVSITGNTIHVCNAARRSANAYFGSYFIFAGVRMAYDPAYASNTRSVDGLVVSDNVIAMDTPDIYSIQENDAISTGGIVLVAATTGGSLTNATVSGNVVKSSLLSGIRVGALTQATGPIGTAKQVRVVDNTIVDAGSNSGAGTTGLTSYYRHAIGLFGNVAEIDIARNMIYDTLNGAAPNGLYSLYVKQASAPSTTTIRTSQNTVRVASTDPNVQLQSSFPPPNNVGIVDATNANNVALIPITGLGQGNPQSLNVDFTSFTRYIVTISGTSSPSTINVLPPTSDMTGVAQWTVGQLVTFRFRCQADTNPCRVKFDSAASTPAYSMNGDLPDIRPLHGVAITFQVENFSTVPNTRRFFELYRTPTDIFN